MRSSLYLLSVTSLYKTQSKYAANPCTIVSIGMVNSFEPYRLLSMTVPVHRQQHILNSFKNAWFLFFFFFCLFVCLFFFFLILCIRQYLSLKAAAAIYILNELQSFVFWIPSHSLGIIPLQLFKVCSWKQPCVFWHHKNPWVICKINGNNDIKNNCKLTSVWVFKCEQRLRWIQDIDVVQSHNVRCFKTSLE